MPTKNLNTMLILRRFIQASPSANYAKTKRLRPPPQSTAAAFQDGFADSGRGATETMLGRTLGPLAGMWAVWGGLLLWTTFAQRLNCPASAPFLILLMASIALSGAEAAFYRRHAFVARYLVAGGTLFRLLSGRFLTLIWQGAKGILLGLALLISSLRFAPLEWLVLFLDTFFLLALTRLFVYWLSNEVRIEYRMPMARRWALRLNAWLLWLVLIGILFVSPHENYQGLSWQEVVAYSAAQIALPCDVLGLLARLNLIGEALPLWAAQNLLGGLQRPAETLFAWVLFVAAFGASFLVAWSYSRALGGVASQPWKLFPPDRGATP